MFIVVFLNKTYDPLANGSHPQYQIIESINIWPFQGQFFLYSTKLFNNL